MLKRHLPETVFALVVMLMGTCLAAADPPAAQSTVPAATQPSETPAAPPPPTPTPAPETQPAAPTMVGDYKSDFYRFTIKQPYFPSLDPKVQNPPVIAFSAPTEFGFSANINVLIDPVKTNIHDYLLDTLRTLKRAGAHLNGVDRSTVDGHETCLLDWESKVDENDLRYLTYIVIDQDRVAVVTCTSLSMNFSKYEARFRDAIKSFRITAPAKP